MEGLSSVSHDTELQDERTNDKTEEEGTFQKPFKYVCPVGCHLPHVELVKDLKHYESVEEHRVVDGCLFGIGLHVDRTRDVEKCCPFEENYRKAEDLGQTLDTYCLQHLRG